MLDVVQTCTADHFHSVTNNVQIYESPVFMAFGKSCHFSCSMAEVTNFLACHHATVLLHFKELRSEQVLMSQF